MKILIRTLILFIFVFSGCELFESGNSANNGTPTATPAGPPPAENDFNPRRVAKPEQILIFVDLTSSVKPDGIQKISEKLKRVLLNSPRDSFVTIRLLEKNLLGESPFPELQTPSICSIPDTPLKRVIVEAEKECRTKNAPYVSKVEFIAERIKALQPHQDISCIINSLEAAHDFFKGKSKENFDFRLIYFSDMIEQCNSNGIYLCGAKKLPTRLDIRERIATGFNPSYNLSHVIGPKISIIVTNNYDVDRNCLSLSEQKDIWASVFTKTGYAGIDVTDFNFTQEIPEQLIAR